MRTRGFGGTTLIAAIAVTALGSGPAPADSGSVAALEQFSVVPWSGSTTVQWREDRDRCDGCIASTDTDSGKLTYTITGGSATSLSPDWSSYQATATGSGTVYSRYVDEYGTDECTQTWTASDRRVDGLRIGISAATMSPGGVGVEVSGCFGSEPSQDVVGDFPSDGIGDGPDNNPGDQRPLNDEDPDPNILRGTTVFAAQPNWDQLKEYTYTLSYDLTRMPDACPARPGVQKLECRPTWVVLSKTKSGVKITPNPKGSTVLVNWGPVGGKGSGGFRKCSGACFIDLPEGTWWVNAQIKGTATLLPSRAGMRPVKIAN